MKNFKGLSDDRLVQMYINGDSSAFNFLVKRHTCYLERYIFNIVKDDMLAEDIFQETCLKVMKILREGKYGPGEPFKGWLASIADVKCLDNIRKENMLHRVSISTISNDDVFWSDEKNPEDIVILNEGRDEITKLSRLLPFELKEVFQRVMRSDCSFEEVSKDLGLSEKTVNEKMNQALIYLGEKLKGIKIPTESLEFA